MTRKPRIGLALGSGSARGWAHIGVIRALEERGVKPDVISSSSIGALVGAAYASGQLEKLEKWCTSLAWTTVVRLMDLSWSGGLIRGARLFNLFNTLLDERPHALHCDPPRLDRHFRAVEDHGAESPQQRR